jgi:hypothetical protein
MPFAPPMTLGNMRANGVRTLAAWCLSRGCNHSAILDVTNCPDGPQHRQIGRRAKVANMADSAARRRRKGRFGPPRRFGYPSGRWQRGKAEGENYEQN